MPHVWRLPAATLWRRTGLAVNHDCTNPEFGCRFGSVFGKMCKALLFLTTEFLVDWKGLHFPTPDFCGECSKTILILV